MSKVQEPKWDTVQKDNNDLRSLVTSCHVSCLRKGTPELDPPVACSRACSVKPMRVRCLGVYHWSALSQSTVDTRHCECGILYFTLALNTRSREKCATDHAISIFVFSTDLSGSAVSPPLRSGQLTSVTPITTPPPSLSDHIANGLHHVVADTWRKGCVAPLR